MSSLRDFLLAPAPASERRRARAVTAAASLGVVAPAPALAALACAVGVALASRGRGVRPVVWLYTGAGPAVAAQRRGRVLVAQLPGDPDDAVREVLVARAAAAGAPCVLGVSLRATALDRLLADLDAVLVVPPPGELLAALAWDSTTALGRPAVRVAPPSAPLSRGLAAAGLVSPAGVRRAIAEVTQ